MADKSTIMRRVFEEVWNQQRLELIDETHTSDFVWHGPLSPNVFHGREAYREFVSGSLAATPDMKFVVEDEIIAGDKEVIRWTNTGTHTGDFAGFPPTGNKTHNAGISIVRLSEGKIAEEWVSLDSFGLMQQVGAVPSK